MRSRAGAAVGRAIGGRSGSVCTRTTSGRAVSWLSTKRWRSRRVPYGDVNDVVVRPCQVVEHPQFGLCRALLDELVDERLTVRLHTHRQHRLQWPPRAAALSRSVYCSITPPERSRATRPRHVDGAMPTASARSRWSSVHRSAGAGGSRDPLNPDSSLPAMPRNSPAIFQPG